MSLIYDIARGSFVDGPGIRTTVFFKGCPLDCPWCHNPESKSYSQEIYLDKENCISCGNCTVGKDCYTGARRVIGRHYDYRELINAVLADKSYYLCSNGGVTFSGGEPLSFIPYLSEILPELKQEEINVAVQTSGYFDYSLFTEKIEKYIDLIFFDIKILDNEEHERITGKSNTIILENFERLISGGIEVIPRIPLIPGYTTSLINLGSIASYFKSLGIQECEFLYYNNNSGSDIKPLNNKENESLVEYFKKELGS